MKTNTLLTLSVVAVGTLFAASAQAGWSVGVSVHPPVYYSAPVYVTAPPYCPPPRVVCYPSRPVYVPACNPWGRYDYDRYDRHDWRRGDRYDRRGSYGYGRNDCDDRRGAWHR